VVKQLRTLNGTGRGEDDCLDGSVMIQLRAINGTGEGLTTEAARIRSKSNRQLFVRRSPQKTHDRSRKDSQQKRSSIVRYSEAITVKDSRQKPQEFAAKAVVNCSLQ